MRPVEEEISKIFYPQNERVGIIIAISSGAHKKQKNKYLVLTVTITKPTCIQLYTMKRHEKDDWKKVIVCSTKNLKKLDCRDTKYQPTYDIQITTDFKTWNFTAAKLEEKQYFVNSFCRIVGSLQPQIFKEMQLVNLPANVDFSTIGQHNSLESLLNPSSEGTKRDGTSQETDTTGRDSSGVDSYRPLTAREEDDIRQFLDELDKETTQKNASELTELLQKQLADVEGTNIHTIMASEQQVLKLMVTLDDAIKKAEKLESQLDFYHQFLVDVEEAMSTLHDRDQLVQITVDNRGRLLKTLENLVARLSLDAKSVRALMEVDLDSPAKVALCTEAASQLDSLLNAKANEGEESLRAVQERTEELKRLRDTFAGKLATKVNDVLLRFSMQLSFVMTTSSGSVSDLSTAAGSGGSVLRAGAQTMNVQGALRNATELHATQRSELLQLAPLVGGWLQQNRKDVYTEIKRTYTDKMQQYFRRQILELFNYAQQGILQLVRPAKGGHSARPLESAPVDTGSVLSVYNPEGTVLNQVASVTDEVFHRIMSIFTSEEKFLTLFFRISPDQSNRTVIRKEDELDSLANCMNRLFCSAETDSLNFVSTCEQIQPVLAMPLLVVISRLTAGIDQTDRSGITAQTSFTSYFFNRLTLAIKRSFNRYIGRLINSFTEAKPSKKARCGVLRMVRTYVEFAECSMTVFSGSSRVVDLERAHGEIVRALMVSLERVAAESVKTPREVVQLENYHQLNDIVRRLKLPGLEEYKQEAKNRYTRALEEYTKNCMGRPLEKLATFFENVQTALDAGVRPEVVQYQFAFSKQELRKVIKEYPGREVKRGLESLCKKVERHLSEENNLFLVVWRSIQGEFFDQCQRFNTLISECYPDSNITLEFTKEDLQNYFTDIARSH
ncbi:unnamed protein product [Calicophoron daubneyi]|uniref:Exocyst complex component 1 n=1 Tax=Calicophoron daubneyi TaxID=300641 RepID=A0AAV2THD9_CALDB